jgi:hypothetical protein
MGDKPEAPPPPDYTPIAEASKEAAAESIALQREQFAWAKQAYAENKGVTDKVVESFLDTQATNTANAAKDRARYEQTFQPLEDSLAQEAQDYATPGRKELERGRAVANVSQQFENARQSATQQLESFGINPASTRYAALDIGVRTQQAAAAAGAANQSDQQVDATGRALRSEAINVGRGYPGQIAGTYSTANQAGQGAVNSGLATTASGASTMGTPTQYGALGATNLQNTGNIMAQGYKDAFAANDWNSKQSSGWGTALGIAAGVGSKFLFANEGGAVPDGTVPPGASPTGGQAIDDVPARLTAGEYVTDKDTVQWYGQKFFVNLKLKAQQEKAKMEQESSTEPQMREAVPTEPTFDSPTRQALPV